MPAQGGAPGPRRARPAGSELAEEPGPPTADLLAAGVFETVLVVHGEPVRLAGHLARLDRSVRELYGSGLAADLPARVADHLAEVDPVPRRALRVAVRPHPAELVVELRPRPIGPPLTATERSLPLDRTAPGGTSGPTAPGWSRPPPDGPRPPLLHGRRLGHRDRPRQPVLAGRVRTVVYATAGRARPTRGDPPGGAEPAGRGRHAGGRPPDHPGRATAGVRGVLDQQPQRGRRRIGRRRLSAPRPVGLRRCARRPAGAG